MMDGRRRHVAEQKVLAVPAAPDPSRWTIHASDSEQLRVGRRQAFVRSVFGMRRLTKSAIEGLLTFAIHLIYTNPFTTGVTTFATILHQVVLDWDDESELGCRVQDRPRSSSGRAARRSHLAPIRSISGVQPVVFRPGFVKRLTVLTARRLTNDIESSASMKSCATSVNVA